MKMEERLVQILLVLGVLYSQRLHGQYLLIQNNRTWTEAEVFCRENYLGLALIHNESDLELFREMMSDRNFTAEAWVGLSVDVNTWRWSYQNQNLTLSEWNSGEPNNAGGGEECGLLVRFGKNILWNDYPCSRHLNCVCYEEQTKNYTYISDKTRTWYEAQQYCRRYYTDLAMIRNTEEQNQMMDLVSERVFMWVGLFRDSWTWLDGTPVSSTAVGRVNADNSAGNEACGWADSQGRAGDASCSLLLPFVCSRGQRRQLVRIEMKSNRSIENDPQIQASILQQIHETLLHHGMAVTSKTTWRVQTDGLLFHKTD